MSIKKVAVIGAGVMGAGIAAQLANAGIEVELLDRVDPKTPDNRTAIAEGAISRLLKTNPAPLMHKKNVRLIRAGNTEDHLDRLKNCDLIIEAVYENPKLKSDIFKKIDAHRKPGAIVASNTSTIPLRALIADQSDALKKDFVITHFFNPPRYMPLLELITSEHNSLETVAEITRFMDKKMGKGVIPCHDTPGFIGNRIGTFWIQTAINAAYDRKLTVEEADALMGAPIGAPKSGVFGLADLVGLDLMPHISKSLLASLPSDDSYVQNDKPHPVIDKMIADGFIGRKAKGGFYRRDERKNDFMVDLETGMTRPKSKPRLKAADNAKKGGLRALISTKGRDGDYAWDVLKKTLCYAAEHAHEITTDIVKVDEAMKLGYGWEKGPFEMIDEIGVDYFIKRLKKDGDAVPSFLQQASGKTFYRTQKGQLRFLNRQGAYEDVSRPEGVLLLSDIKRKSKPVIDCGKNIPALGAVGAKVWDIGDGVLCVEFVSKMNTLDFWTMKAINKACDLIEKKDGKYKALVFHNEGKNFSSGANIGVALMAAKAKQLWIVEKMLKTGQETMKRLKYAKFPVVSAPSGMALGGGCEVLMHSHHVQAHAETYMGLVEVGVGLLPAWGGSTELLTRAQKAQDAKLMPGGPIPPLATAFETISTAKVSTSAFEAKDLFYLRDTDGVTMNKFHLLADAKAKALELAKDFKPELPMDLRMAGPEGLAAIDLAVDGFYLKGQATPYDVVVSERVAHVLSGGDAAKNGKNLSQDEVRALERAHFMALIRDERTVARIASIIKTGTPLREKPIAGKTAAILRDEANRKSGFFKETPVAGKGFNKSAPKAGKKATQIPAQKPQRPKWLNRKK